VRRLSVLLLAAAILATGASASTVDARLLVLQRPDVPAGFGVDRHGSRYWPNAAVARSAPQSRKLLVRSGRVSGYAATYENGAPAIVSTAHLFRKDGGAHVFYSAEEAEQRALDAARIKRGGRAYRHERVVLGDEALMYRSTQTPKVVLVLWRSGRVVGAVTTWGFGRDRTVALAEMQQLRIAKTLG
jgi:hypothetical protein